jgi:hypothetical protein
MSNGSTDRDTAVSVSGHYHFATKEYQDAVAVIDEKQFKHELKNRIYTLVDMYRTFDRK